MANSKYEYVKSYETDDKITPDIIIVVRVVVRDYGRFSEVHEFEKPNDVKALGLMNDCAKAVLQQFPDVIFSYGYHDEYSFTLKKSTEFYQRRDSKIRSIIVSFFTSTYVTKWNEFFPRKDLRTAPSFQSRVICCPSLEMLQAYLAWRQNECHLNNQHDTCVWQLVNSGKSKREVMAVHSKNIASSRFWKDQWCLVKELGLFTEDSGNPEPKYIKSFQRDTSLLARSNWIVIRIDGCHFHRFSDRHEFEKPNDARALNLMNSCAVGVIEEFKDIVFSYGVSDEYSFVLKKDSQLYERRGSEIVSAIVSFFTSTFTMKWKEFFPEKKLKYPPYFDGRAVCYPSSEILRDYLSWRQVDCHINNQYNTCFWMLVKSGKSKSDAQKFLKGTQTEEKNAILDNLSGVSEYYNTLPLMFRHGSSVFWKKEEDKIPNESVVVMNCNIIEAIFWELHKEILTRA